MGVDAPAWTPALVQQYLEDSYDVHYSITSCRRSLNEAGLRYQNRRYTPDKAAVDEHAESRDDRDKSGERWMPQ
ncbi:helix-turn-helix domain-containing protein [Natrinema gelatinilyticum]|uniref:helix-turn-helix domain-containing protein n=1 Tax=Natrinema gelatinilyticum TaxID=2961571 RepID=UPI003CE55D89